MLTCIWNVSPYCKGMFSLPATCAGDSVYCTRVCGARLLIWFNIGGAHRLRPRAVRTQGVENTALPSTSLGSSRQTHACPARCARCASASIQTNPQAPPSVCCVMQQAGRPFCLFEGFTMQSRHLSGIACAAALLLASHSAWAQDAPQDAPQNTQSATPAEGESEAVAELPTVTVTSSSMQTTTAWRSPSRRRRSP